MVILYQLQHARTDSSLFPETASFHLFSRVTKNPRPFPQLLVSTKLKISRRRYSLIWHIPPACLAAVKVQMSRKCTILFWVTRDRCAVMDKLVIFCKGFWDDESTASVDHSKASPYDDQKQLAELSECKTFSQWNLCIMGTWFKLEVIKSCAITIVMVFKSVRYKHTTTYFVLQTNCVIALLSFCSKVISSDYSWWFLRWIFVFTQSRSTIGWSSTRKTVLNKVQHTSRSYLLVNKTCSIWWTTKQTKNRIIEKYPSCAFY